MTVSVFNAMIPICHFDPLPMEISTHFQISAIMGDATERHPFGHADDQPGCGRLWRCQRHR